MEKTEIVFADGFKFEKPREGAPELLKGRISVNVATAIETLKKHQNNGGWVNINMWKSKEKGTIYFSIDTWKPTPKENTLEDADSPF